jgi:hypothetical protein
MVRRLRDLAKARGETEFMTLDPITARRSGLRSVA